jgi:hypothetical protein
MLTIKKNKLADKIRPKKNTRLLLKKASTKEIMFSLYHVPPFLFKHKAMDFFGNFTHHLFPKNGKRGFTLVRHFASGVFIINE